MREFLITKLYCSVCGTGLEVCSAKDKDKAEPQWCSSPGAPSGAYVSDLVVSVQPCRHCEPKHRRLQDMVTGIVQAAVNAGVDLPGTIADKKD